MIKSDYYTDPVVVWEAGQPAPKTPWLAMDTENPIYFVAWSYSKWGKKIAKGYFQLATGTAPTR